MAKKTATKKKKEVKPELPRGVTEGPQTILVSPTRLVDKDNIRAKENYGDLVELANSIAERGQRQVIEVHKNGSKEYVIISGHRRAAAIQIGVEKGILPKRFKAWVIELEGVNEQDRAISCLVENLHRKDLTMDDQAEGVKRLMQIHKMSKADIAKTLAKRADWVNHLVEYLGLNAEERDAVKNKDMGLKEIKEVARLKNDSAERMQKLRDIKQKNFEKREEAKRNQEFKKRQPKQPKIVVQNDYDKMIELLEKQKSHLGASYARAALKWVCGQIKEQEFLDIIGIAKLY